MGGIHKYKLEFCTQPILPIKESVFHHVINVATSELLQEAFLKNSWLLNVQ